MSQYRITKEYGPEDLSSLSLREYVASMPTKEKSDIERLCELEDAYSQALKEMEETRRITNILIEGLYTAAGILDFIQRGRMNWRRLLPLRFIFEMIADSPGNVGYLHLKRLREAYGLVCPDRVITRSQWDRMRPCVAPRIYKRDGHACVYCGSRRDLTIDHVVPVSKGGRHIDSNLVACCSDCNTSKGDRNVDEWLSALPVKTK
jgi:hypothetical protein